MMPSHIDPSHFYIRPVPKFIKILLAKPSRFYTQHNIPFLLISWFNIFIYSYKNNPSRGPKQKKWQAIAPEDFEKKKKIST